MNRSKDYRRQPIIKPQRPTSSEGIQIKWADLSTATPISVTTAEFKVPGVDHSTRQEAQRLKEYASKTSIQFAHAGGDGEQDSQDRLMSITKAHFAQPKDAAPMKKAQGAPPNVLWESEYPQNSVSMTKVGTIQLY